MTDAAQIVREEWHRAVEEFGLTPGSPVETVVGRVLTRLAGVAADDPPAEGFEADKAREMARWARLKMEPPTPAGGGGHGHPDPDVFPLTDAINALDGIYTLQSCAGHGAADTGGDIVYPGQLWLRLDAPMAKAFERLAPVLAMDPLITGLSRHWGVAPYPVVDIRFRGNEFGTLARSTELLIDFWTGCRRAADRITLLEAR